MCGLYQMPQIPLRRQQVTPKSPTSSSMALQLWYSVGLSDNILPVKAVLYLFCPLHKLHLLQIIPDIIFPSRLGPSSWSSCEWFPFVYSFYCASFGHSIYVSKPTQLLPKSPTLPPNSPQAWCMYINLHICLIGFIELQISLQQQTRKLHTAQAQTISCNGHTEYSTMTVYKATSLKPDLQPSPHLITMLAVILLYIHSV